MTRSPLFFIALGALGYYGFARWRGVIVGAPWAPMPAGVRNGA